MQGCVHAAGREESHTLGQSRTIRRGANTERLEVRMVTLAPRADDGGTSTEGKRCGGTADGT